MRTITTIPGRANSLSLEQRELPEPEVGSVLVRVIEVGVCGTDWDVIAGRKGLPPAGTDRLILGHESLGRVESSGDQAGEYRVGDLVVATVRRGDDCPMCCSGRTDLCETGGYRERGIFGLDGFMQDYYLERPENLVKVPPSLRAVGVLVEPLACAHKAVRRALELRGASEPGWGPSSAAVIGAGPVGLLATMLLRLEDVATLTIARSPRGGLRSKLVEATGASYAGTSETPLSVLARERGSFDLIIEVAGASEMVFQVFEGLARNGIMVLTSATEGDGPLGVRSAWFNREMVRGNRMIVGSNSASRADFHAAVDALAAMENRWSQLLERMITRRLSPEEFVHQYTQLGEQVKPVLVFADGGHRGHSR